MIRLGLLVSTWWRTLAALLLALAVVSRAVTGGQMTLVEHVFLYVAAFVAGWLLATEFRIAVQLGAFADDGR